MNLIEVYQKLANDITFVIDSKLKNIERDRTFKGKIIEKVSDNKYKILYKNKYYTARCYAELSVGNIVYVCAPENNWSELFINLPCSRAEFESVKNDLVKIALFTSDPFDLTAGTNTRIDIPVSITGLSSIITAIAVPIGGYPFAISINGYSSSSVVIFARSEVALINRTARAIVFYK